MQMRMLKDPRDPRTHEARPKRLTQNEFHSNRKPPQAQARQEMTIMDTMGRHRLTDLHPRKETTRRGAVTDHQEARQAGGMVPPAEVGAHLEAAVRQAEEGPREAVTPCSLIHSESTGEEAQEDRQAAAPRTATAIMKATGTRRGCLEKRHSGIACWTGQASSKGRCVPT